MLLLLATVPTPPPPPPDDLQMADCQYLSSLPGSRHLEEAEAWALLLTASKIFHITVAGCFSFIK